jgi:NitT/TauT family transport system substrate-binding protein
MGIKWPQLLIVVILFELCSVSDIKAQSRKLNVTTTGVSPTSLVAFVAKDRGIFAKNGLDVQVIRATSSVSVLGLISGDLSVIEVAAPTVVTSNLRGADVVFIAAGVVTLNYWLMSAKSVKTPAQLKGGVIGSSDLSGSSFVATQFAVRKLGLNPDQDVSIIRAGGTPERIVGLRTGRIQATVLNPPTSLVAQKEEFNVLTDVTGMPFQHNGVVTTRKFIRENTETVRKYIKAHIEAIHLMKTDREAGITVLMKSLKANESERELVAKSYNLSMGEEMYPHKQYPSLPGLRTVLDSIAKEIPAAKGAKPEDFVDNRFIKELDESGFIDGLYAGKK